ncbi:MAG: glycosyltransferase [Bacteroidota bacterium]
MIALVLALVVCCLVQAGAWAWIGAGFRRVREDRPEADGAAVPVSVVVAARNESARLGALLDYLTRQTHGAFEVVIVDDRSTDATAEIVSQRADTFPVPLRLVRVRESDATDLPPKKHALTVGIEAATHERLAFTDADCTPPPGWLATLARHAHETPEAVLVGYGPLVGDGWLGRFCRYETARTAALSAGAIGHGWAWHAVGRSLSYPRALWHRLGGFAAHADSLSGDDDLLVQHAQREGVTIRYVLDAEAHVPSPAPTTWRAFWRQKRRHASAGAHYDRRVLLGLGAMQVSSLALWIGAPLLHAMGGVPWGWGLLATSVLLQRAVLSDAWDTLGARADLRLWHPVLEVMLAGYQAVAAVLGALPTPRRW